MMNFANTVPDLIFIHSDNVERVSCFLAEVKSPSFETGFERNYVRFWELIIAIITFFHFLALFFFGA
jgi:hypothetical protein